MFNADDYNDNIEYCRYVFEKNIELDLGLSSPIAIQNVANNYFDEICARRGIIDDGELYEDDELLLEVKNKFDKKTRKFKQYYSQTDKYSKDEENYDMDVEIDKNLNKKGGYSYNDSLEEASLDDISSRRR